MNSQNTSPRLLSVLFWVGLALFPTLGTLLPQVQSLTDQRPILSWVIIVFYECLVFLLSLSTKTWKQLEGRWTGQFADWIDQRKEWMISRTYRQYCQHLEYQNRFIDVKGLQTQGTHNLALQQVFVELSMVPTPVHQASTNPLDVPPKQQKGTHPMQDFLSSSLLKDQHLVILGAPGSGKTTLLKYLILDCLKKCSPGHHLHRTHWFPILLFLREHVESMNKKGEDFSLADAVSIHAKKWWKLTLAPGWIEQQLTQEHCLICLDGLDEVADVRLRSTVVEWIERQITSYGRNRFIITSRPHGYQNTPLNGVMVLEVHHLTPEQIEQFIQNWYLANEIMGTQKKDQGVHLQAAHGADDLLRRLHTTPALYALAVNPLLLTMIATVHRYRDALPDKRIALYEEICDVFLGKRDESKGLSLELTAAQKRQVLQPLAYHMMQQGRRELPAKDLYQIIAHPLAQVNIKMQPCAFVDLVEQTSGLLLEREVGSYSFAHLTFQEFLAAVYIKEASLEQELCTHIAEGWWHETIRLYCAQADATAILTACLAGSPPQISVLTLAWECQQEALKVKPEVRLRLDHLLTQGVEDANQERRHLVAEVLLARRQRQVIPLKDETFVDTSLITNAEYQLFLDANAAQGRYQQPDNWNTLTFPTGQGMSPISGVRWQDAQDFCQWLSKRDTGLWQYRLPSTKEVEDITHVKDDMSYWLSEGSIHRAATQQPQVNIASILNNVLVSDLDLNYELTRTTVNELEESLEQIEVFNDALINDLVHTIDPTWVLEYPPISNSQCQVHPSEHILHQSFSPMLGDNNELAQALIKDFAMLRVGTLALDHEVARIGEFALNLIHVRSDTCSLAQDMMSNGDLSTIRARAHKLAQDLERIRVLSDACAFDRTFASASSLAQELVNTLNLSEDLSDGRVLALDLILALNIASSRVFALNPDCAHTLTCHLPQHTASTLMQDIANALAFDLHSACKLARSLILDRNCDPPGKQIWERARDFDAVFNASRMFVAALTKTSTHQEDAQMFRQWLRLLSYLLAMRFRHLSLVNPPAYKPVRRFFFLSKQPPACNNVYKTLGDDYLLTYARLALLEGRVQGKMPSQEGILLVKQRLLF